MSAEVLRQAASLMRGRANRATTGPYEFRSRRGFESMGASPATIGFNDTAGYFVMLREGLWATEGDMSFLASWHPAVALAVADWLDKEADGVEAGNWRPCLDPALAVARTYLGDGVDQ